MSSAGEDGVAGPCCPHLLHHCSPWGSSATVFPCLCQRPRCFGPATGHSLSLLRGQGAICKASAGALLLLIVPWEGCWWDALLGQALCSSKGTPAPCWSLPRASPGPPARSLRFWRQPGLQRAWVAAAGLLPSGGAVGESRVAQRWLIAAYLAVPSGVSGEVALGEGQHTLSHL